MDLFLTPQQLEVRRLVREFTDKEIMPYARENDALEKFPSAILKKMGDSGLLGAIVPKEYGGMGWDYVSEAIMLEEVGRGCSSVRTIISVQVSLVELALLKWGTDGQKKKYLSRLAKGELLGAFALTEPEAGSDAGSLKTTASRTKDGWRLNGSKTWITSGGVADLIIVFANVDPSKGVKGITAFLLEKSAPGFTTKEIKGKLGMKSANTAELFFNDCKLSADTVLGNIGEGFKIALTCLDNGRYGVAAGAVGIIQGCIEACTDYSLKRKQFGKAIASFQSIQDMIARMVVDRDAARLLVYRAGELKNRGLKNTLESSIAKYFASEAAVRAATDAIQIHGAYGYSNAYPVERYLRDAKVTTIYEGTSQIQKLVIGREVLGVKAFA